MAATQPKLGNLSPEAKKYFVGLLSRGMKPSYCARMLYKTYPDEHRYSPSSIQNYLRSEDRKVDVREVLETQNEGEHLKAQPFATYGSRAIALMEMAQAFLELFREAKKEMATRDRETPIRVPLNNLAVISKELRSIFSELSSHLEDLVPAVPIGERKGQGMLEGIIAAVNSLSPDDRTKISDPDNLVEMSSFVRSSRDQA